ncbi:alpha-L-rhamnosidase [Haloferula helveola]|uniref:Alpha-L-rhamnosidase n=2 Tax=Haloferula helveola TaxID=490095 RepID=A0ABM7RC62_9BACT|nr:alpha-L-rhamnosidase [Haloferula helveola]
MLALLVAGVSAHATPPEIAGELKQWHKVTLTFEGPQSAETATPNPFADYRFEVRFKNGNTEMRVPGYFAADGDSANTSAEAGNRWRVHFSPPFTGEWTWKASLRKGPGVAVEAGPDAGMPGGHFDGDTGSLTIGASDKHSPDMRALGRLAYVGDRYPRTLGDGRVFLKTGVDAPENLLAYADFDGDFASDGIKDKLIKTWQPHVRDWRQGDPVWSGGKGKGLIGAVNYLAGKGLNSISFLTMNIGGDDANVFPYRSPDELDRIDVSRMDQWEVVFAHATAKGMFLHFKTQESENETLLDKGDTGPLRKLYYRELVARFSHHPALNWNMGEENGKWKNPAHRKLAQTTGQRLEMGRFIQRIDPYDHPIVIHNGQWFDDVYGDNSPYCGASLQTSKPDFSQVHKATLNILRSSARKGKQWMVACDEPGDAEHSLLPDAEDPDHDNARQGALWGNLLAGGWGVEWYFGYKHPHSDLTCQDFRSRDRMWDQCRHARDFFRMIDVPLTEMTNEDGLLAGADGYCLAKRGEVYLILLRDGSSEPSLDLTDSDDRLDVRWFDPRHGGGLKKGSVESVSGPGAQLLGKPPGSAEKDWVVIVRHNIDP